MSRDLRYLPRAGCLVEITQRTIQGRFLLRPSRRLNALVVGCFARAQRRCGGEIHAVAVLSNHFHLLASFDSVRQMAAFMCHLKTNLSKEVGRLHDWPGPMFGGRYQSIPVSDEPEAQQARLTYLLSQGAKEGLVLAPRDWPGVHSASALDHREPLRGLWFDRTRFHAARQRDRQAQERDFATEEALHLSPLPCWTTLEADLGRERLRAILREIEDSTLAKHRQARSTPLGTTLLRRVNPKSRPQHHAKSTRPRFHAATNSARSRLIAGYREFLACYRRAAEQLAAGARDVTFPDNCFLPRLAFVEPDSS